MAVEPLTIGGTEVRPGSRRTIDIPAALLYTHAPVTLPVQVIRGRREGPVLLVNAAIHGDEINGVEIIRRLLQLPALRRLRGTLLAVPIVNVFGFTDRSRYLPDRRDLNRAFPGSERGSLASRLANLFRTEILAKATHVIDLHTGAIHRENLPQVRANLDDPDCEAMAQAFGTPVIINTPLIEGSLRQVCNDESRPVVTYEAGEALRFDEQSIKAGVQGVVQVMRHLGMIAPSRSRRRARESYAANNSTWVRAEQDGMFRAIVALGAHVQQGQALGFIADPFGEKEIAVEAITSGIVIGRNNLPLVHEGEALFHIARFDAVRRVARYVKAFNRELEEDQEWQGDDPEPPIV
ncbi:succinylglutamate desuccinylase/aspartoacylase family protein [Arhodomonas sp. AD133]|uniref:succinylglutamate desuccinylase/aspartoacylase family protein n=1 Tax=Arhodomonas sp. AD133 TaxID=3415009 RepID=UPI003EC11077